MNTQTLGPAREDFVAGLVSFLNNELPLVHPKAAGHSPIDRATLLFDEGGIDSLSIIHIVAFLEKALGAPLDLQDITMKNFRTVDDIASLFALRRGHGSKS